MISGQALLVYKQKTLLILDDYKGSEAGEQQVIQDFQIRESFSARPDDVRQALEKLKDDGLAEKRRDTMRGWVWKITADGRNAARDLEYERL